MKSFYEVRIITREQYKPYLLDIHYAKRIPSVTYSFGLFESGELVGVVTYGTPPSSTLRRGLAGDENSNRVIELNRLCLKNNKYNEASFLISKSLKMLPKGKIIISFADTEQDHNGAVYRASNFKYYGLSAKRTDWKIKGREHLHGISVADEFRGMPNRASLMRNKYGDNFYLKERPRKHRYVYITGGSKFKWLEEMIKYKLEKFTKEYRIT